MYLGRMRNNGVLKSGHLYISAKGIGWKSWKRRWFILTRTSLVFFKAEPKGQVDFSMALGGIYLNNSGSVHPKMEKKLLSVVFPDMRVVRLKAESSEDLEEWREALENALAMAPEPSLVADSGGFLPGDSIYGIDVGRDADSKDKRSLKALVVGRPVLLALEELDGSPSFLEKALCFIETNGLMVEGILRQSADVEDVEKRVKEYEQGRNIFTTDEDAHVIGDCVKHVLRELPSSPVPTNCCLALLAAHRLEDREQRVEAMRMAVADTFPEPNRTLLQRILRMMRKVSSQAAVNRMTKPAVAACMAPLLLRPLLAGDCIADDDNSEDGSSPLTAATHAANQANAIVTLMMEEYERVFPVQTQPKALQCEEHRVDNDDDGPTLGDQSNGPVSSTLSDTSTSGAQEGSEAFDQSDSGSPRSPMSVSAGPRPPAPRYRDRVRSDGGVGGYGRVLGGACRSWSRGTENESTSGESARSAPAIFGDIPSSSSSMPMRRNSHSGDMRFTPSPAGQKSGDLGEQDRFMVPSEISDSMVCANARIAEEESQLRQLKIIKEDMEMRLKEEEKSNETLIASLESRKQALREQRITYEEDIASLQDKLHRQREIKAALESGMGVAVMNGGNIDCRLQEDLAEISALEADVAKLKSRVAELQQQTDQEKSGMHMTETERQERKISLLKLRSQLEEELERTMAMFNEERARNAQFEEQYHNGGEEAALERLVIQQRQLVQEAQVSERSAVAGRMETDDGKEKHGTSHAALTVAAVFVSLFKKKLPVANSLK